MLTLTLPFSLSALRSVVRRYLAQPSAELGDVMPRRLGGGFSGSPVYRLKVSYHVGNDEPRELSLIYKEGTPFSDTLASDGAHREMQFYRTLAPHLPIRTPRILLSAHDASSSEGIATGYDTRPAPLNGFSGPDWVLLEAMPAETVWPQATWSERHYLQALNALADLHAHWWGRPPDPARHIWVWTPTGDHAAGLARDAHDALLELESTPWIREFFTQEELREWLRITAEPQPLLDVLNAMPHTLIHGDYWPGNIALRPEPTETNTPAIFDWQFAGAGPAAYDLACFHSTSRWWFGRLPLSLADMRSHYLARLNPLLPTPVDRALFDVSLDASRAWRFATFWPHILHEYTPQLRARRHYLQTTLLAPALASLRRVQREA